MKKRMKITLIAATSVLILLTAAVGGLHLWLNSEPVTVRTLSLEVCGEPVDLGDTPVRLMNPPPHRVHNGTSWGSFCDRDFCYYPLISTLRALGIEVGEVVDGEAQILYEGAVFRLSIPDRTIVMESGGSNGVTGINLLAPPVGGHMFTEVVGDEILVDGHTLIFGILHTMHHYTRAEDDTSYTRWVYQEDHEAGVARILLREDS